MTILVTGGAGFIGSHLVEACLARGKQVRVLDNLSTGCRQNLVGQRVEFVEGDVADFSVVAKAVAGCELVFHQAAMVSVPRSVAQPDLNHATNVTGAFNVFEAARRAGVKRVVFAFSAAVYGDQPGVPQREDDLLDPMTPYGVAKLMNEQYATTYRRTFGMELIGLRYMNVFGPRQDPSSPYSGVLSLFCRAAMAGNICTIYGVERKTRDFVCVSDVVQANLLAADTLLHDGEVTPVFNIGRGEKTDLLTIVKMLSELQGRPLSVTHSPERPGDIRHSVADISRAQARLGYQPTVSLREGLRKTLNWFGRRQSQ